MLDQKGGRLCVDYPLTSILPVGDAVTTGHVSMNSPVTISISDTGGGTGGSTHNVPTATAGTETVGSQQAAIKFSGVSGDAPGLAQEDTSRLANPGGYSGTNLTHEQLEAFGFAPRRESHCFLVEGPRSICQISTDMSTLSLYTGMSLRRNLSFINTNG